MANVQGKFYTAETQRRGVTPVSPPNAVDDPQDPVSPSSPVSFISLIDTPSSYVGQASKIVSVKSDESGLEFITGGGTDTNAVHYNVADGKNASERLQARVNIGSTSSTPQIVATSGAINDLTVTSNHLVFTGESVVLSGIVAGLDGEEITILNVSGTSMTISSQDVMSLTDNRFNNGVIIPNLSILRIKYRTTTNRWFLENTGINDLRYVRKDIADTKTGTLTQNGNLFITGDTASSGSDIFSLTNSSALKIIEVRGNGTVSVINNTTSSGFNIKNNSTGPILTLLNSAGTAVAAFRSSSGFSMGEGFPISLGTTTGSKIGNTNLQKLGFWGETPIIQPLETGLANTANSGDANTDALITALKNVILNTGLARSS